MGGVLGGLFNALLAPVLFKNTGLTEYPLAIVLACFLLRPRSELANQESGQRVQGSRVRGNKRLTKQNRVSKRRTSKAKSIRSKSGQAGGKDTNARKGLLLDAVIPLIIGAVTVASDCIGDRPSPGRWPVTNRGHVRRSMPPYLFTG